jgi:hypothetical protein
MAVLAAYIPETTFDSGITVAVLSTVKIFMDLNYRKVWRSVD